MYLSVNLFTKWKHSKKELSNVAKEKVLLAKNIKQKKLKMIKWLSFDPILKIFGCKWLNVRRKKGFWNSF